MGRASMRTTVNNPFQKSSGNETIPLNVPIMEPTGRPIVATPFFRDITDIIDLVANPILLLLTIRP